MKIIPAVVASIISAKALAAVDLPKPAAVLAKLKAANAHFMAEWPDVGKTIITNRERPSNIWTRAVYYEGLMGLQAIAPDPANLDYALRWAEFHRWGMRSGDLTRNADDQCCLQTYIDLYRMDPQPERIRAAKANLDAMVASDKVDDWSWVDAIQMAMPALAKYGRLTGDARYFEKAHAIYTYTKLKHGGGLYNATEHLWWRDKDFVPPFQTPNGRNCHWSRGNGWVFAALVRVLEELPADATHRGEYEQIVKEMAAALAAVQRDDGFWNVSLHDPAHYGGKETTGTALFVYGMAWGVRHGLLDEATYLPVVARGWHALAEEALHPDGFLGYVQGTGKQPSEGQPVTYDHQPDFTDFGLGCFLLAGTEIYRLASR